eukprot:scaffold931_cov383-Prasinococcus_capsulatus_cf.AAC.33
MKLPCRARSTTPSSPWPKCVAMRLIQLASSGASAPSALPEPTSSWSNKAIMRIALSSDKDLDRVGGVVISSKLREHSNSHDAVTVKQPERAQPAASRRAPPWRSGTCTGCPVGPNR